MAEIRDAQQSLLARLPARAGLAARAASMTGRLPGISADIAAEAALLTLALRAPSSVDEGWRDPAGGCLQPRTGNDLDGDAACLVQLAAGLSDPRIGGLARLCARMADISSDPA